MGAFRRSSSPRGLISLGHSLRKKLRGKTSLLSITFLGAVIIIVSLLQISSNDILLVILVLIVFVLLITLWLRDKHKSEVKKILRVINKIRTNLLNSVNEIELGKDLKELETEIKSMFLRTQNDIANLKKLEQVRTEFLGNVSHELRTPIFAIQGFIETLLDGAIDDTKVNRTFLHKANQHTINLNNLLNDLIDISMIESGQMQMSFRYFNVHDFLENIVHDYLPQAEYKKLELRMVLFDKTLQLFGDRQRLKQVMTNLIMNAIKYTEKGLIEVGVKDEKNSAKIFVHDTGIGISEEDKSRIFERFYRVDKDRSREMGGTGLGLAIAKHIIEAHSSKIEVKSEIEKGSVFSFRLKK